MHEALEKCPCCGGRAAYYYNPGMSIYAGCTECGLRTRSELLYDEMPYYLLEIPAEVKERAAAVVAALWNRRK